VGFFSAVNVFIMSNCVWTGGYYTVSSLDFLYILTHGFLTCSGLFSLLCIKCCLLFCDILLLCVTVCLLCIVLCVVLILYCVLLVTYVLPPFECVYCT
jgi:hypothetical protein